jgi:hypothetical protein
VALRFFTEADLDERARTRRERVERDELWLTFARWLMERAGNDGPVTVPTLTAETEARLIRLLRER